MDESATMSTCGLCDSKVLDTEIPTHPCTQAHKTIFITTDKYFYAQTDDGSIITDELQCPNMSAPNKNLASTSQVETSTCIFENTDLEGKLIAEVRNREVLWNHRLPITMRGRNAIATQWQEVSVALNDILTAAEAAKKWKNLKDSFMRCINEEKKTQVSGAGAVKKSKWKWLDDMAFLRDPIQTRRTVSSISSGLSNSEMSDSEPVTKRRRVAASEDIKTEKTEILRKISDALSQPIYVPQAPILPSPPAPQLPASQVAASSLDDECDVTHILSLIGNSLRRMPLAERLPFSLQLLQLTYNEESQLTPKNP